MPPYMVSSRSPSVNPSTDKTSCSQFCVARYSVKMMTRSFDHFPPGLRCSVEPVTSCLTLESRWPRARFGPLLHLLEQGLFVGGRLGKQSESPYPRRRRWLRRSRRRRRTLRPSGRVHAASVLYDGLATFLRGGVQRLLVLLQRGEEAAGQEKSRFFSVFSTNSVANRSALSSARADRSFGVLAEGPRESPALRRCRELRWVPRCAAGSGGFPSG